MALPLLGGEGGVTLGNFYLYPLPPTWGSFGGVRTRAKPTSPVFGPMYALLTLVTEKLKVNGTSPPASCSIVQIEVRER